MEACSHPDHAAVEPLVTVAIFYARLGQWAQAPGAEALAATELWVIERPGLHG